MTAGGTVVSVLYIDWGKLKNSTVGGRGMFLLWRIYRYS